MKTGWAIGTEVPATVAEEGANVRVLIGDSARLTMTPPQARNFAARLLRSADLAERAARGGQ